MTVTAVHTLSKQSEIPTSYGHALADGWRVIHERTPLVHGAGRLLMRKEGVAQLISINYQPTAKGYTYSTPQVATPDAIADAENCWAEHFREFGCAACSRKDLPHAGNGLCASCRDGIADRQAS